MLGLQRGKALLLGVLFTVWSATLFWFLSEISSQAESALRIVCGAFFIFLLPGLVLCEVFHFRARHPWETVAIALTVSLLIEIVLLPIPFFFHASIEVWIGLLFATIFCGLIFLALPCNRDRDWTFLAPLMRLPSGTFLSWAGLIIPCAMAVCAYLAGEDLFDVEGEKMLHLMFVRYYHDMPLSLLDLGVRPGVAPPNLVNLWEFLLAAWARCVHLDPLLVFFRARCVIPVLGLAGLYLLLKVIFTQRRKVDMVFFGILLMCLANCFLMSPGLKWVNRQDPTRGVFAFMGTVHHADPAVDILLPLSCAMALQMVRRLSGRSGLLFAGILAANFLWHPREFLQLSLYLGVMGITIATLPALRKLRLLRNWACATGLLFLVAASFLLLSSKLISNKSHAYDEVSIKKAALRYAAMPDNVKGVRNFFHMPYILMLSSITERDQVLSWDEVDRTSIQRSWQLDYWLLLAGIAIVVLGFFGRSQDRAVAMYAFWLWLLALAWNCSMLIIVALTYSEFFMVTPRLLFLFAYILIATLLESLPRLLHALVTRWPGAGKIGLAAASFVAGQGVWLWQHFGSLGAYRLSFVLSFLMWLAAAWMVLGRTKLKPVAARPWFSGGPLLLLFFAPFLVDRVYNAFHDKPLLVRSQPTWFESGNPFQFSAGLIAWLRELPPRQTFLVHPDGKSCIHAYAPHYETILPVTVLLIDMPVRQQIEEGQHPLLIRNAAPGDEHYPRYAAFAVDHEKAQSWLSDHKVQYLLLNHEGYDNYLRKYIDAHPRHFSIVYDNPPDREMVVSVGARP